MPRSLVGGAPKDRASFTTLRPQAKQHGGGGEDGQSVRASARLNLRKAYDTPKTRQKKKGKKTDRKRQKRETIKTRERQKPARVRAHLLYSTTSSSSARDMTVSIRLYERV